MYLRSCEKKQITIKKTSIHESRELVSGIYGFEIKLEQKKALQENEKMEKQGWEIRVESDNKNGIHAMDLL